MTDATHHDDGYQWGLCKRCSRAWAKKTHLCRTAEATETVTRPPSSLSDSRAPETPRVRGTT